MTPPVPATICETCHGLTWVTVETSFYPRTKPCPDCAAPKPSSDYANEPGLPVIAKLMGLPAPSSETAEPVAGVSDE